MSDTTIMLLIGAAVGVLSGAWAGWHSARLRGEDRMRDVVYAYERLLHEVRSEVYVKGKRTQWEEARGMFERDFPLPKIYTMPSQQELARWQAVVDSFDDVSALDDHPPK